MMQRFCRHILDSPRHCKSFRRLLACHYSGQLDNKDGHPQSGNKQRKHKIPFTVEEERRAQEFLDNMDEIMKRRMKRIEDEVEEQRCQEYMPAKISAVNWKVLLTETTSANKRLKYLRYLAVKELREQKDKEEKLMHEHDPKEHRVLDDLTYPSHNRAKDSIKYGGYRSMVFGNPLVFDCDFEASHREQTNCMDQLLDCYGKNLRHPNPFHLHFTGYKNSRFGTMVEIENLEQNMFASFHEGSFLDLFDRSQLIYLCPDGPLLKEYDGDKVYIIGALVDLHDRPRTTLAKARELDITCGRLPLEKYIKLKTERDLTLIAVLNIMLHLNLTHDWGASIRKGLPRGKYQPMSPEEAINRLKKKKSYAYKHSNWNG